MYVYESTQILKALDHHNLTIPAHAFDVIDKLYNLATDLRCRDTPPAPIQVPQFALIYGKGQEGKERKNKEGGSRSVSRNSENGSRSKNKTLVELTDSDPDMPMPANKNKSTNGYESPSPITKAPKRQLGSSITPEPVREEANRSPSPDIFIQEISSPGKSQRKSLHKSGSAAAVPSTTEPSPNSNQEGETSSSSSSSSSEAASPAPGPLPDLRLPHLQKKPIMPSITVPPSILSPGPQSGGHGPQIQVQSPQQQQQQPKPVAKNVNTIVVSSASTDHVTNSPKRRQTGRVSTARRITNRENMLGRRTLAAIQLQRTRSSVSFIF